ncbi:hypothetical protein N8865_02570 [Francisellaceae bacterium]|nr:hypothetical protein [Francisellaceae bacterium]
MQLKLWQKSFSSVMLSSIFCISFSQALSLPESTVQLIDNHKVYDLHVTPKGVYAASEGLVLVKKNTDFNFSKYPLPVQSSEILGMVASTSKKASIFPDNDGNVYVGVSDSDSYLYTLKNDEFTTVKTPNISYTFLSFLAGSKKLLSAYVDGEVSGIAELQTPLASPADIVVKKFDLPFPGLVSSGAVTTYKSIALVSTTEGIIYPSVDNLDSWNMLELSKNQSFDPHNLIFQGNRVIASNGHSLLFGFYQLGTFTDPSSWAWLKKDLIVDHGEKIIALASSYDKYVSLKDNFLVVATKNNIDVYLLTGGGDLTLHSHYSNFTGINDIAINKQILYVGTDTGLQAINLSPGQVVLATHNHIAQNIEQNKPISLFFTFENVSQTKLKINSAVFSSGIVEKESSCNVGDTLSTCTVQGTYTPGELGDKVLSATLSYTDAKGDITSVESSISTHSSTKVVEGSITKNLHANILTDTDNPISITYTNTSSTEVQLSSSKLTLEKGDIGTLKDITNGCSNKTLSVGESCKVSAVYHSGNTEADVGIYSSLSYPGGAAIQLNINSNVIKFPIIGEVRETLPEYSTVNDTYPVEVRFSNLSNVSTKVHSLQLPSSPDFKVTEDTCLNLSDLKSFASCTVVGDYVPSETGQKDLNFALEFSGLKHSLVTSTVVERPSIQGAVIQKLPFDSIVGKEYNFSFLYTNFAHSKSPISAFNLEGLPSKHFTITNTADQNYCGKTKTLAATGEEGDNCIVNVQYVSSTAGPARYSAALSYGKDMKESLETSSYTSDISLVGRVKLSDELVVNDNYNFSIQFTNDGLSSAVISKDLNINQNVKIPEGSDKCSGVTLGSGQSCTIEGSFTPNVVGDNQEFTATISYGANSEAKVEAQHSFSVKNNIAVNSSLDGFPYRLVSNGEYEVLVTFTNSSDSANSIIVDNLYPDSSMSSVDTTCKSGKEIKPGDSCTVRGIVKLPSPALHEYTTSISFKSKGANVGTIQIVNAREILNVIDGFAYLATFKDHIQSCDYNGVSITNCKTLNIPGDGKLMTAITSTNTHLYYGDLGGLLHVCSYGENSPHALTSCSNQQLAFKKSNPILNSIVTNYKNDKFMYGDFNSGPIYICNIDTNGKIQSCNKNTISGLKKPTTLQISHDDKYLYTADYTTHKIYTCKTNFSNNTISSCTSKTVGGAPHGLAINKSDSIMYIAKTGGIISQCPLTNGAIGRCVDVQTNTKDYLVGITLSPNGKYIFANPSSTDRSGVKKSDPLIRCPILSNGNIDGSKCVVSSSKAIGEELLFPQIFKVH